MSLEEILVPLLSGFSAWLATVAVIRNDIGWIKENARDQNAAIRRAHQRIDKLERR